MTNASTAEDRRELVRQAFFLEYVTLVWMVIEAAVAIGAGAAGASLTFLAFGLDSLIELVSAGVLIWRLTSELRGSASFLLRNSCSCTAHEERLPMAGGNGIVHRHRRKVEKEMP
jgi:hypothetical protein